MKQGRLKNDDRDQKMTQGKTLFVRGFSLQTIADIIGMRIETVQRWKQTEGWQAQKDLYNISPSEIKTLILENVRALKEGKEMHYKADDISKLTAAFDKISDRRKQAIYTIETFNAFCDWLLEKAAQSKGKKRAWYIDYTQSLRTLQEEYLNTLLHYD